MKKLLMANRYSASLNLKGILFVDYHAVIIFTLIASERGLRGTNMHRVLYAG